MSDNKTLDDMDDPICDCGEPGYACRCNDVVGSCDNCHADVLRFEAHESDQYLLCDRCAWELETTNER